MATPSTGFFCCTVCEEKWSIEDEGVKVAGYDMCLGCFEYMYVSRFDEALAHEAKWPVEVCGSQLNPEDYPQFFGDDFLSRWNKKQKEYNTPMADRMYCGGVEDECGYFLGSRPASDRNQIGLCPECEAQTCFECGKTFNCDHGCGTLICRLHVCTSKKAESDPLEGQVKGKDYQTCPRCNKSWGLQDGCNHMVCPVPCGANFCFICGEEAEDDSDHWVEGMPCPRWNQPGTLSAHHDRPPNETPSETSDEVDAQLLLLVVDSDSDEEEDPGLTEDNGSVSDSGSDDDELMTDADEDLDTDVNVHIAPLEDDHDEEMADNIVDAPHNRHG